MNKIKEGDRLLCIFDIPLPGNECGPEVKRGETYPCKGVYTTPDGRDHVDVGLPLKLNFVTAYGTAIELPKTTHWCHPNRFIVVNEDKDGTPIL